MMYFWERIRMHPLVFRTSIRRLVTVILDGLGRIQYPPTMKQKKVLTITRVNSMKGNPGNSKPNKDGRIHT